MSSVEDKNQLLKFSPFISCVDPSFWHRLSQLKLDVDKLEEKEHRIWGYYCNKKQEGLNQVFCVDASSFNAEPDGKRLFSSGKIINKNTIESFKEVDKRELLRKEGMILMEVIKNSAIEQPALLNMFLIISFADLKQYHFYYKFLFLAPTFISYGLIGESKILKEAFTANQLNQLLNGYNALNSFNKHFFLIKVNNIDLEVLSVKDGLPHIENNTDWIFGFADSCELENPGWPLRNFLAFLSYHCGKIIHLPLQVLGLRLHLSNGVWKADNSVLYSVKANISHSVWDNVTHSDVWVGWERNEKGQIASKTANLKPFLDPVKLAEASVDLNLKLMKWQLLPELNLDVIKNIKCLLLGAGTLGCAVGRNLLSWGVHKITFVDCGNVSYSNPVRQSLFKFKDVGLSKAKTAAAALKEIYPNVDSSGFDICIPMPGHTYGNSLREEAEKNIALLEELFDEHDVIFLLMDSRESRWLPTLIAAAKHKLVINAALGFDSFLVMRHGLKSEQTEIYNSGLLPGSELGCYFCNDVTAPGNSSKLRTLDQQCTVTRPGMSSIAGALSVELLVSILQHPQQGLAPAETDPESEATGLLGIIPHSIRGFMSHYRVLLPATKAFSSCVACSVKVVNEYRNNQIDFILKAIESKDYLEELCGLRKLCEESLASEVIEYSDFETDD